MRRQHESVKDWKPCSICGSPTPYVHKRKRYCVKNACQLKASAS